MGNTRYAHLNYCVSFENALVWEVLQKVEDGMARFDAVEVGVEDGEKEKKGVRKRWGWIGRGTKEDSKKSG